MLVVCPGNNAVFRESLLSDIQGVDVGFAPIHFGDIARMASS